MFHGESRTLIPFEGMTGGNTISIRGMPSPPASPPPSPPPPPPSPPPSPPPPSLPPITFKNVLLPDGPFGNAQKFTWGKASNDGNGGTPSQVADGKDEFTSSGWQSEGFQSGASGKNWIQVTLPAPATCKDAAVIGYPGGSHMPTGTNNAKIWASADGSNWVVAAQWTKHPGCQTSYCTVSSEGSDFGITKLTSNYDTYKIDFSSSVASSKYQYWRVGGESWTNNHLL